MLDIDVDDRGPGVLVISLKGSLDFQTSPELEQRLSGVLTPAIRFLVFQLEELTMVTSAGLRIFLVAERRLRGQGGAVRFSAPNENITQVFDVTGLRSRSQIFPSLDAALQGTDRPA